MSVANLSIPKLINLILRCCLFTFILITFTGCGGSESPLPEPLTTESSSLDVAISSTPSAGEEPLDSNVDLVNGTTPVTEEPPDTGPTLVESQEPISSVLQISEASLEVIPVIGAVREPNNACIPPQPVVIPGETGAEAVYPNLPPILGAVAMVQPKNDSGFWLVATISGHVYSFDNSPEAQALVPVMDLSSKILSGEGNGEFGLTGFAIHPDYPADNRVFIVYNDNPDNDPWGGRSVLSYLNINVDTHIIDPQSETVLLSLHQPSQFHNGGDLSFGSDGLLYASFGDGDNPSEAQNLTNLLGSLIRIDVDNSSGAFAYSIPSNNPLNNGQSHCGEEGRRMDSCPEIFAYGFRNPWRFSLDMSNDDIWLGDVGDDSLEEVNRVFVGGNYGWPTMEGSRCVESGCDQSSFHLPIADYGRDDGVSVVGGYVYRGNLSPSLVGQYIFTDVYSGKLFSLPNAASTGSSIAIAARTVGAYAMAQGNDGEVYLLNSNPENVGETVYRITGSGGANVTLPQNLSEVGCIDTLTKISSPGVFDYSVINPLWTDGAAKRRGFAIPNDSEITVLADGDFQFPTNSVLVKHFLYQGNYIETRLLINHSIGWRGYSYEWNNAQTDAQLLSDKKSKTIGDYTHLFPDTSQCSRCHTGSANVSLGVELSQLNKTDTALSHNIVDYLNSAGFFSSEQSSTNTNTFKLSALNDSNASVAQKVKSYLHSNCSGCHRPGSAFSALDFRFTTPLASMGICDQPATEGTMGLGNPLRLAPGKAQESILYLRVTSVDPETRMPPLGTMVIDQTAVDMIEQWINGLQGCE